MLGFFAYQRAHDARYSYMPPIVICPLVDPPGLPSGVLISEVVSGQAAAMEVNNTSTEHTHVPVPYVENGASKIRDFCSRILHVSSSCLATDVAHRIGVVHRIGALYNGTIRPIVVRFKDKESTQILKQCLKTACLMMIL